MTEANKSADTNHLPQQGSFMDAATLTALQGSIAKWEAIATGDGADDGCDNCPLCQMFWVGNHDGGCEGCPVFEKTGKHLCIDSPYIPWHVATAEQQQAWPRRAKTEEHRRLARAEVDFLKSLLPASSSS